MGMKRWWLAMALVGGLAAPAATHTEAVAAPAAPQKAAPSLPDGTFVGALATPAGDVAVRLVVAGGMLVSGVATRPEGETLALAAAGAPDAVPLQASGKSGSDFLRLTVEFFDPDRGTGSFEGVLGRKRVSGTWIAERR